MNGSVSIAAILCNYNGGKYLKEAIDSVLAQEHLPDEFIIVDDKSTDNSIEVIRESQIENPELINFIQHEENKGQAAGMNTAYASSRCEILAFLDSDDVWFPNKLAFVCDAYKAQPDFGLFQHNLQIIQGTDVTGELFMPAMTQGDVFELWHRYHTFPNFSPTSGLAIRREVFAKLAPLPIELIISSDSFMTRSAICFGQVVSTLTPLGGYRKHSSNNVCGNSEHNAWNFFLDNVSPLLADFYQSQGFAFPSKIEHTKRQSLSGRILDLNMRSIIRKLRAFSSR